jgi:hypothetical protein
LIKVRSDHWFRQHENQKRKAIPFIKLSGKTELISVFYRTKIQFYSYKTEGLVVTNLKRIKSA